VHDTAALEQAGITALFVASDVFEKAAKEQSRSLGTSPRMVLIAHPIQDRTDEEMVALADGSVENLIAALTS